MHIITVAQGYSELALKPFFQSAEEQGLLKKIILISPDYEDSRLAHVEKIRVPGKNEVPTHEILARRWQVIRNVILKLRLKDTVLICDCRDLIFQGSLDRFPKLGLHLTHYSYPIGSCYINSSWLVSAYGDAKTDAIKPELVICGGIVWGQPNRVADLCLRLMKAWESKPVMDQAHLNYLVHGYRLPCTTHTNGSLVLHMDKGSVGLTKFENGIVKYLDVCVPPIVHNWDWGSNVPVAVGVRTKYMGPEKAHDYGIR